MDLTQKKFDVAGAVEKGAILHLVDPFSAVRLYDGKDPITITVRGIESQTARAVAKKHRQNEARGIKLSEDDKGLDNLNALIIDWAHIGNANGDLECTPENVRAVLAEYDWIAQQVLAFAMERSNFFTASSGS